MLPRTHHTTSVMLSTLTKNSVGGAHTKRCMTSQRPSRSKARMLTCGTIWHDSAGVRVASHVASMHCGAPLTCSFASTTSVNSRSVNIRATPRHLQLAFRHSPNRKRLYLRTAPPLYFNAAARKVTHGERFCKPKVITDETSFGLVPRSCAAAHCCER